MTGILTLIMTFIGVLLIPLLAVLWRGAVKWTRVETKLDNVIEDLKMIVEDKDKVHREMTDQMREDRKATNDRLTWLERNLWERGKTSALRSSRKRRELRSSEQGHRRRQGDAHAAGRQRQGRTAG